MMGDWQLSQRFIDMLYRIPVLLISFTVHELSHAVVALKCGDRTAKNEGRITLNPVRHIDPIGALLLLVAGFGWAKPVPINTNNFRNKKVGIILTSIAGPLSNIVLAFIFTTVFTFFTAFAYSMTPVSGTRGSVIDIASELFLQFIMINISLAAFNIIPIPPLDGSKVLFSAILPERFYFQYVLRYEHYGMIALIILSVSGLLDKILQPIVTSIMMVLYDFALSLSQLFI